MITLNKLTLNKNKSIRTNAFQSIISQKERFSTTRILSMDRIGMINRVGSATEEVIRETIAESEGVIITERAALLETAPNNI